MKTNLKLLKVSHPALILTLLQRREIDKNHLPEHGKKPWNSEGKCKILIFDAL